MPSIIPLGGKIIGAETPFLFLLAIIMNTLYNNPMEYFYKKERNPYVVDGNGIKIYSDLPAASFFHPGLLKYLFFLIRKDDVNIGNEDNDIRMFIRFVGPSMFRATYSMNKEADIQAFDILTDGHMMSITKDESL